MGRTLVRTHEAGGRRTRKSLKTKTKNSEGHDDVGFQYFNSDASDDAIRSWLKVDKPIHLYITNENKTTRRDITETWPFFLHFLFSLL